MALSHIASVKYYGVSACVPKTVLRVADYEKYTPEKAALFSKQTGIVERRWAKDGLIASDMCLKAAQDLLADLKWDPGSLDGIIFVSQSMDYPLPATACILQNRLGAPKSCLAFDIGMGCSGYVYGSAVAASMVSSMRLKRLLLLVGDNAISFLTPESTSSYPLFGDAGTATAMGFDEQAPEMFFDLNTDGSGYHHIIRKYGGFRHPIDGPEAFEFKDVPDAPGAKMRGVDSYVAGAPIMEFAMREVKPSVLRVLGEAGLSPEQVDFMFAHQANRLINETVRKMAKIAPEKHPYSLTHYGNTSAPSIPLTMVAGAAQALRERSVTSLLTGFGVGLSWGSAVIRTRQISCPPIAEI